MKLKYVLSLTLCFVALCALVATASAMIESKWTVEKQFKESAAVAVGKVVEVVPDSKVASITFTKMLKQKPIGPNLRVQILTPVEFIKEIKVDQPIVAFLISEKDPGGAIIHLGDTWFVTTGAPLSNKLLWKANSSEDAVRDSRKGFPGSTAGLVKLVTDLNAGTNTFMDKLERKLFSGGIHKRGKINIQKPKWMLAEDVNGDKKPDLIVGTAAGTKLFLATADSYEDATEKWGLTGVAAKFHAVGDANGDGKPDLILDGTLWINQDGKFAASKTAFELPSKGAPLAAALIDATGGKKPDAYFLSAEGEVRVYENSGSPDKPWTAKPAKALWTGGDAPIFATFGDFGDTGKTHALVLGKSGITRYALDADGGPAADLTRLTGVDFKKNEKYQAGFKNATAVSLSMNGESRPDLFVYSDAGSLLLLNRGLGAFFLDDTATATLTSNGATPLPVTPSPTTVWARADLHGKGLDDILLLGEDGTLYEIDNSAK